MSLIRINDVVVARDSVFRRLQLVRTFFDPSSGIYPSHFYSLARQLGWGLHAAVAPLAFILATMVSVPMVFAQEQQSSASATEVQELTVSDEGEESSAVESGLSINAIDTQEHMNLSADINRLINATPGVIIRESGGLGSSFKLSLNGLSDKQIRYFVDGMPMENFGSALTLNNFPVNLVTGVDIYKGVTPIALSADALGGAINISTASPGEQFADLSYSVGSFNTHRVALVGQTPVADRYYVASSVFFNHSDNDYTMTEAPRVDDLGNLLGTLRARRFHDEYTSHMVNVKAGVLDTRLADDLSLSITVAGNKDEVQHPDTSINQVFGGVYTENDTRLVSVRYRKAVDAWRFKGYLLGGQIDESFFDTVRRDYDWTGAYEAHGPDRQNFAEFGTPSIFDRQDEIVALNGHTAYAFSDTVELGLAVTHNQLVREGNDRLNPNNLSFADPNQVDKTVVAAELGFTPRESNWRGAVFLKNYHYSADVRAELALPDFTRAFVVRKASLSETGYGASAKYQLGENLDLKASYEYAIRLPEPDEILGTGQYVLPNPDLKSEKSQNINLGAEYRYAKGGFSALSTANLFYRNAEDFIKYPPGALPVDSYENLADVNIRGAEFAASLFFPRDYSLEFNVTLQDMRDESRVDVDGQVNLHKGDRIPNEPYQYANLRAGKTWSIGLEDRVSAHWSTNYVHAYFLFWESAGDRDTKYTIPTQLTHDLDVEYSFGSGRYNLSASVRNLFDEAVFDNRDIQKPGRAFYLKFRYLY